MTAHERPSHKPPTADYRADAPNCIGGTANVRKGEEAVSMYRHKKRGSEYELIGFGKMQADNWFDGPRDPHYVFETSVDMAPVAIYRSTDDGSLWVRPREEFEDGRFEVVS